MEGIHSTVPSTVSTRLRRRGSVVRSPPPHASGKGEDFAVHRNLQHIVRHLAYPLDERYVALLAYQKLYPTYRDALTNRVPMSLDDLESRGLQFEKLQKLNYRWSTPPTAEKMHILYATPKKQASRKTIAAASVSGEVAARPGRACPHRHRRNNSSNSDRNSSRHPRRNRLPVRRKKAATEAAEAKQKTETRRANTARRVQQVLSR